MNWFFTRLSGRLAASGAALAIALSGVMLAAPAQAIGDPPQQAQPAGGTADATSPGGAAPTDGSSMTVKWAGGNPEEIQRFQVARDGDPEGFWAKSGHWGDFKDLEVTVSKTAGLADEVITVSASGMARTSTGRQQAKNFLQLMQCWGDSPLDPGFEETCVFGSGIDVYSLMGPRNVGHRGIRNVPHEPSGQRLTYFPRFRAVDGKMSEQGWLQGGGGNKYPVDGLSNFFTTANSNENLFVRFDREGKARVGFETQSAVTQPYLGCGGAAREGKPCWLVVVPRGGHSPTWPEERSTGFPCSGVLGNAPPFGEAVDTAWGPAITPDCANFNNRIAIPLHFTNVTPACRAGVAERPVIGTELVAPALSAWQPELCGSGPATYSMNTAAGDNVRGRLLTGDASFATIVDTLAPGRIGAAPPSQLDTAQLRYAPLVNTALALSFTIESSQGDVFRDVKLTPRLLAKLFTQSYSNQVPMVGGGWDGLAKSLVGRDVPQCVFDDPEWQALKNPRGYTQCLLAPYVVTIGPQGDDSIAALWAYIQADADAAQFLRGEADPWGMTINPSYLPSTHARALDGGIPIDLSRDRVDAFFRADRATNPANTSETQGKTIDSTSYMPYLGSFAQSAARVFRADDGSLNQWDRDTLMFKGDGPPLPGSFRELLGPVALPDAVNYLLPNAQLAAPLARTTGKEDVGDARTFVAPTPEAMSAAVGVAVVDAATGHSRIPLDKIPATGYPLTLSVNAAVDLAAPKLDARASADYAALLRHAAGPGQIPGEGQGELPGGYVPLSAVQRASTERLAAQLLLPRGGATGGGGAPPPAAGGRGGAAPSPAQAPAPSTDGIGDGPATATSFTGADDARDATPEAATQTALGLTLLAGLAGAATAPFLLRRRGVGL